MVSADVIRTMSSRLCILALALVLAPSAALAQDEVVYYHTDAIGSVRIVTDATGAVVARYDYMPFGETWPTNPPNTAPDVRQFAGKERNVDTSLDYFGARYLRAQSGRFKTVDPVLNIEAALLDPQRWNRYAYALNNPLRNTDPDGRDPRLLGGVIGTLVYAGWNAYANVQAGRPWHQDIGVEASKGFVVGVTLGVVTPMLGAPAASVGLQTASAGSAVTAVAKSSSDIGRIIGWGTGQTPESVAQTLRVTQELTRDRVAELTKQGVTKEWVEQQLKLYEKAVESGGARLNNAQLLPRLELMKKLLELF